MGRDLYQIRLDIQVEPWMYKYLAHELGESPWTITRNNYHGIMVTSHLSGKIKKPEVWKKEQGKVVYSMIIPKYYVSQYGAAIFTEENVNSLLKYFQDRFKRELFLWVEGRLEQDCANDLMLMNRMKGGKRVLYVQESILSFCEKMGLTEEEMPYDTLKKRVYRYFAQKQLPVALRESV